MSRVVPSALACLILAGCVTNQITQAVQTQQTTAAIQGNQLASARPGGPTVVQTPAAQLSSARLITSNKVVASGSQILLGNFQSLTPDCAPLGEVSAKVITPPSHGTVMIEHGMAMSNFTPGDPPYRCNSRKTPALVATYVSNGNYIGDDVAVVEVFFPDGKSPTVRFNIAVR